MVSVFLGLTIASLSLLAIVFAVGLGTFDPAGHPTSWYTLHLALGIAAGMIVVATHVVTYMYFMATSRWIQAAGDKVNLPPAEFAGPAFRLKKRALIPVMTAIAAVMLTMFAGAAADPLYHPWWPGQVHMAIAIVAIAVNVACALIEFRMIRQQGALMDRALDIVNHTPGVVVENAA